MIITDRTPTAANPVKASPTTLWRRSRLGSFPIVTGSLDQCGSLTTRRGSETNSIVAFMTGKNEQLDKGLPAAMSLNDLKCLPDLVGVPFLG